MWILKNFTNLLSSLDQLGVHKVPAVQTFDFSIFYTFVSHDLPMSHMDDIIITALKHKNGVT